MISFQDDWYFFMRIENATCKDDLKQMNVMIMAAWGIKGCMNYERVVYDESVR